ncbi:MAG: Hsp20/alpha crystallin family protein [Spirochaetota bacterium]|nr:MAG: Hsp20/alpha crystallin family protein [Spirochaetota bacterium]
MNLIRYRPRTLDLFDWDRAFERFLHEPFNGIRTPAVDIREDDNGYKIEVELPGLTEKDIEVKVENNVLSISSKKEEVKEDKDKDYVHKERRSYSFSRSFTLPENVKTDKIDANFKNGLLNISIPKAPESKPKLIEVKVK